MKEGISSYRATSGVPDMAFVGPGSTGDGSASDDWRSDGDTSARGLISLVLGRVFVWSRILVGTMA